MRIILLLALLTSGITTFGQISEFEDTKNKVKSLAEKSQWDELMMTAPELITSEPGRYEGYYYTALAFSKIRENATALEYISIALEMASEEEKSIVLQLKQDVEEQKEVNSKSLEIESKGKNTDPDGFKKLWELDKSNLDYALTAIELYLDKKDYPSALSILSDPQLANDPKAKKLVEAINKKPEMIRLNAYKRSMELGKKYYNADSYQSAITKFDEALKLFPGDAEAVSFKRKSSDELAWQIAKKENSFTSYKTYLKKYPLGKYKSKVDEILQKSYLDNARKYRSESKFSNAESFYQFYQNEYPNGPQIATVNFELCNLYLAEAKKQEKNKTVNGIRTAQKLYAQAQRCNPATVSKSHLESLAKKEKKWSRPSVGFFGWSADEHNMLGFTAGSLNTRKVGFYLAARSGNAIFKEEASWETDDLGSLENSGNKNKSFIKDHPRIVFATMGITKKIVHPLWIYAGAGIAFNSPLKEFKHNDSGNEEFVKNADQQYLTVNPEVGVHVKLSFVTLRYGINKPITEKFKEDFIQNFGVAICF